MHELILISSTGPVSSAGLLCCPRKREPKSLNGAPTWTLPPVLSRAFLLRVCVIGVLSSRRIVKQKSLRGLVVVVEAEDPWISREMFQSGGIISGSV